MPPPGAGSDPSGPVLGERKLGPFQRRAEKTSFDRRTPERVSLTRPPSRVRRPASKASSQAGAVGSRRGSPRPPSKAASGNAGESFAGRGGPASRRAASAGRVSSETNAVPASSDGPQVGRYRPAVRPPCSPVERRGRDAERDDGLAPPVLQVVAALLAGPRPVGGLVARQPFGRAEVVDQLPPGDHLLVPGEQARGRLPHRDEPGGLLDLEQVDRDVARRPPRGSSRGSAGGSPSTGRESRS